MQNAARSLYSSGERLGVNKAVRDAVDDVRKNVRSIRSDGRSHSHSRNVSAASDTPDRHRSSGDTDGQLQKVMRRNSALAQMLEDAVNQLWKQHQFLCAAPSGPASSDYDPDSLTMAIAKAQLAQVYLADPDLPLADDNTNNILPDLGANMHGRAPTTTTKTTSPRTNLVDIPSNLANSPPQASPGLFVEGIESSSRGQIPGHSTERKRKGPSPDEEAESRPQAHSDSDALGDKSSDRPSLEQSSFSWMLGQDEDARKGASPGHTPFNRGLTSRRNARRNRTDQQTDFLFGEGGSES